MSMQDKIAAQRRWPTRPLALRPLLSVGLESAWTVYEYERAEAALARLALAREVLVPHIADLERCIPTLIAYRMVATAAELRISINDLTALLAALEPPCS